jgi:SOS-response transcriptional repressor LexA
MSVPPNRPQREPPCAANAPLLSDGELRVLSAIEDLIAELGYAPTLREIAAKLDWSSTGSVAYYVTKLRCRSVIVGRGRSLRVNR